MLEDCLLESRSNAHSRKPAMLAVSVIVHGGLAAVLILIPLFQTPLLPHVAAFLPLRPPAAIGRSVELVPVGTTRKSASPNPASPADTLTVPPVPPTHIARVDDLPREGIVGAVGSARGGGNVGGSPFGAEQFGDPKVAAPRPPAPPTPPPQPAPALPEPVTVKEPLNVGTLERSKLLHMVQPEYPRLASITRVEGVVVLEAVITKSGMVDPQRLKAMSGHTLLVPAAVDAVRQWRYQPTVLNGEAIEVLATITVNFRLNQ